MAPFFSVVLKNFLQIWGVFFCTFGFADYTTYIIKPNQTGLGSHIANCSYMVCPDARGKGVGRLICEHSITEAQQLGYKAMQFNLVVSTNHAAVALWQKCGFKIIGTIPEGFKHQSLGYVDAHIMYRKLSKA